MFICFLSALMFSSIKTSIEPWMDFYSDANGFGGSVSLFYDTGLFPYSRGEGLWAGGGLEVNRGFSSVDLFSYAGYIALEYRVPIFGSQFFAVPGISAGAGELLLATSGVNTNRLTFPINANFRVEAQLESAAVGIGCGFNFLLPQSIKNFEIFADVTFFQEKEKPAQIPVKETAAGNLAGDLQAMLTRNETNTTIENESNEIVLNMSDILFETGKADILPAYRDFLDGIALRLKKYPSVKLSIEGHTDNSGTEDNNLQLSRRRAKAAADVIIAAGIDASRISSAGYGSSQPVASNSDEEGRSKNRRVTFIFSY